MKGVPEHERPSGLFGNRAVSVRSLALRHRLSAGLHFRSPVSECAPFPQVPQAYAGTRRTRGGSEERIQRPVPLESNRAPPSRQVGRLGSTGTQTVTRPEQVAPSGSLAVKVR